MHGAVLSAVRGALRKADLVPQLEIGPQRSWSESLRLGVNPSSHGQTMPSFGAGTGEAWKSPDASREFVEYFRRLEPQQRGFVYSEVKQAMAETSPEVLAAHEATNQTAPREGETSIGPDVLPGVRSVSEVLQVHSSYIVTQDEHGLVIIDQHALHERVMFERLLERLSRGPLESQRLLMPVVIPIERTHADLLKELTPLLMRIGIEAELIGPSSVGVHSFTSLLFERGVDPVEFLTELLDKASSRGVNNDAEAALHETLDMMACKAAVKAGDRLTPDELADLLNHRERIDRSSNCPHGRPTTLRLSLKELERQFGRS
jgi:DNA mismatch repair protein MutL